MHGNLYSNFTRLKKLGCHDLYDIGVEVYVGLSGKENEGFLEVATLELFTFRLSGEYCLRHIG